MLFEQLKKSENKVWQYIIGIVIILISQTIGILPLFIVAFLNNGMNISGLDLADLSSLGVSANMGLFLMLLPFATTFISMIFVMKVIHKRDFGSLFFGSRSFDYSKFIYAIILWGGLLLASETIMFSINPSNYTFAFDFVDFLGLLFVSLTLLLLQTSTEELIFRGYFMQWIARISRYRIVALIITSLAFGLMHISNPEIAKYGFWLTMPSYLITGFVLGMVVVITDGLEIALGMHFINNFFASTLVTFASSVLSTNALFTVSELDPIVSLIVNTILHLLFLYLIIRKYKFTDWGLFVRKIQFVDDNESDNYNHQNNDNLRYEKSIS